MTRAAKLNCYLTKAASHPFEWGDHDCCTFAADWCLEMGHEDPMAMWRRYGSEGEAHSTIADACGLLPLWELGMITAQIPECDEARLGDVGVIEVLGTDGIERVGAIFGGKRWHALSPNGLYCASIAPEHVIKTWRV